MTIDVMIFTSPNPKGHTFGFMVQHYYKKFEHIVHIMEISNDTKRPSSQIDDLQNYSNTCTWF